MVFWGRQCIFWFLFPLVCLIFWSGLAYPPFLACHGGLSLRHEMHSCKKSTFS